MTVFRVLCREYIDLFVSVTENRGETSICGLEKLSLTGKLVHLIKREVAYLTAL